MIIIYYIKLFIFKVLWRRLNGHNSINPKIIFNKNNLHVGKKSYGDLWLYDFSVKSKFKLKIGDYVSIGPNVKFFLNENHFYERLTTFPISKIIKTEVLDSYSKGNIIVNDEVWIGANSLILSGVNIGKGAIIAAGSVVTKNIEPYSIYGGNPAKLIKMRFSDEIISKVKNINISDLPDAIISDKLFAKSFSDELLEKINSLK